jgi:hypothetical protein
LIVKRAYKQRSPVNEVIEMIYCLHDDCVYTSLDSFESENALALHTMTVHSLRVRFSEFVRLYESTDWTRRCGYAQPICLDDDTRKVYIYAMFL